MTWPLTYDDGINLRSKECQSGMAHYICRIETIEGGYKAQLSCFLCFIKCSMLCLLYLAIVENINLFK